MIIRCAVVQQNHNPGKPAENRRKALGFAAQALDAGADIVLFHEELLIGYSADAAALAEPCDGETTKAFAALLAGSGSKIVYGLTERDGERLYISAPVVTSRGVVALYLKNHLWPFTPGLRDETRLYTPGDSLVTFEHKGVKFGILICYDGDFPQMFRAYADLGCQAVLWMNNRGSRGPEDGCVPNAAANSIAVITACCCGTDEKGEACRGLSNIVDGRGCVLRTLENREGFIMADIDFGQSPPAGISPR